MAAGTGIGAAAGIGFCVEMVEDVLASLAGPCLSCAAARACLEAKKLKGSMCAWKGDEENGEEGKDEAEGATAPAVDAGVDADADSPFCWPLLWLFGVSATVGGECACTSSSVDDAIDSAGLVAPSLPAGSSALLGTLPGKRRDTLPESMARPCLGRLAPPPTAVAAGLKQGRATPFCFVVASPCPPASACRFSSSRSSFIACVHFGFFTFGALPLPLLAAYAGADAVPVLERLSIDELRAIELAELTEDGCCGWWKPRPAVTPDCESAIGMAFAFPLAALPGAAGEDVLSPLTCIRGASTVGAPFALDADAGAANTASLSRLCCFVNALAGTKPGRTAPAAGLLRSAWALLPPLLLPALPLLCPLQNGLPLMCCCRRFLLVKARWHTKHS